MGWLTYISDIRPLPSFQGVLQFPGRHGAGEAVESPTFWRQ